MDEGRVRKPEKDGTCSLRVEGRTRHHCLQRLQADTRLARESVVINSTRDEKWGVCENVILPV